MSIPLPNLVEGIKEALARFSLSDDNWDKVPPEYIEDQIKIMRSTVIRDLAMSRQAIPIGFYQRLCCLEVLCEELSCSWEGEVLKTGTVEWYVEDPGLEQVENNILYFGNDKFKNGFTYVTPTEWQFTEGRVFTGKEPMFTYIDGRILIENKPSSGFALACMIALFEDPSTSCEFTQDNYPIPLNWVNRIQIKVLKHIATWLGINPDVVNNAIADIELGRRPLPAPTLPTEREENRRNEGNRTN